MKYIYPFNGSNNQKQHLKEGILYIDGMMKYISFS